MTNDDKSVVYLNVNGKPNIKMGEFKANDESFKFDGNAITIPDHYLKIFKENRKSND